MRSRPLLAVLSLLILAVGWAASARAEEPRPKLIVMPLQLSSMSDGLQSILDDLATEAIRGLGQHQVLGRSDLDAMLGAQGVEKSGGCDDVSCAAEIGGALGAQFLVAGRVAKLGDNIIIVLKLIDAQERRVLSSIKHKAPDAQDGYDRALGEAVQALFGKKALPTVQQGMGSDDPMRPRISSRDWSRYQYHVSTTGRDIALSTWVAEHNRESTGLLVGEIVVGVIFALSVPLFVLERQKHPDDTKPAVLLALSTATLGTMLGIDFLNIGGIEVAEDGRKDN